MVEKKEKKWTEKNRKKEGKVIAEMLDQSLLEFWFLLAVIATLVVVTLICLKRYISRISCLFSFSLYHRRCIQGLFGSPSATTSTTSKTVASYRFS